MSGFLARAAREKLLLAGIALLVLLAFASLLGPLVADPHLAEIGATRPRRPPDAVHWLGTDTQGRDVLAALLLALPRTLEIGLIAGLLGLGVGGTLGLLAGYLRGWVDGIVRTAADVVMTIPAIAVLVLVATNVRSMNVTLMAVIVAGLAWMYPTRAIRAQTLSLRELPYVDVARINGAGGARIVFAELLPNLAPYFAASFVTATSSAMLATVGLEALGLGPQNQLTLGMMLYWAQYYGAVLRGMWWWWVPPVSAIALIFCALLARLGRHGPAAQRPRPGRGMSVREAERRPVLTVRDLEVGFATPRGLARAVQRVSFTLHEGERIGLVGESGSGKTTTALALMRLLRPPGRVLGGAAWLDGIDLLAASPATLRAARFARIALVPQGAMSSLNPVLRCSAQIEDLLRAHGVRLGAAAMRARIVELLTGVGLKPEVADLFPHQLSGGMKQRVCIAMAMALGPAVILADEPTSALDVIVQKQVLRTLIAAQRRLNAGIVLVGHDMGLMAQFAHTVGVMYAGRLVEIGPVRSLFADPRHPYTRMLIASLPRLDRRREFVGIPGLAPSLVDPPPGCPFHPRCPRATERCTAEMPEERALEDGRRVRCHYATEPAHAA